jgi:hypothetical protein
MLAYVFWHVPAPGVDREDYERLLAGFHRTLAAHAPDGFCSSLVFRIENAPWIGSGGAAYEDWYILESSAALDALNDAAVSGPRKAPHDLVASFAASGAAGLYRLKSGQIDSMKFARHALWFSNAAGSYEESFRELRRSTDSPQTNLWLRQMVLSAAAEFCLRSASKPQLPPNIAAIHCPIQAIYPA